MEYEHIGTADKTAAPLAKKPLKPSGIIGNQSMLGKVIQRAPTPEELAASKARMDQKSMERKQAAETFLGTLKDRKPMFRGNTSGSVLATGGRSYFLVDKMRGKKGEDRIVKIIYEISQNKEHPEQTVALGIIENYSTLEPFIHARLATQLQAGNCGEFSKVVYSSLVERPGDEWVYRCGLTRLENSGTRTNTSTCRYETDKRIPWLLSKTQKIAASDLRGKEPDLEQVIQDNLDIERNRLDQGTILITMNYITARNTASDTVYGFYRYTIKVTETIPAYKDTLDHGFVITCPLKVHSIVDLPVTTAVVYDAWDDYKVFSLPQFLQYRNIDLSNIKILHSQQTTGTNPLDVNPLLIRVIEQVAGEILASVEENMETITKIPAAVSSGTMSDVVDKPF